MYDISINIFLNDWYLTFKKGLLQPHSNKVVSSVERMWF